MKLFGFLCFQFDPTLTFDIEINMTKLFTEKTTVQATEVTRPFLQRTLYRNKTSKKALENLILRVADFFFKSTSCILLPEHGVKDKVNAVSRSKRYQIFIRPTGILKVTLMELMDVKMVRKEIKKGKYHGKSAKKKKQMLVMKLSRC